MEPKSNGYILIVEDAPDLRNLLKEFLESEGFQTRWASNGQEALDLLRSTQELPFFILLDLMMPVMDGFMFRQEQEKDPRIGVIPVVVMTADSHVEEKTMRVGAAAYLKKPITDVDQLVKTALRFQSEQSSN